jgi:GxxExxY protein
MNATERESLNGVAKAVIGAAYEVANVLGGGFLEKVYERALAVEMGANGLDVQRQVPLTVNYKGVDVGEYVADMVVDGNLIVELKCVERLASMHIAQCLNYLKSTGLHLALLINFHRGHVEWQRIVSDF